MKSPKTEAGLLWTKSRKFSFIRSALRRAFTRWPPNYQARKLAQQPYVGSNKLQRWTYRCAICSHWFMGKETQIDHVVPAGSLRDYSDLPGFVARLFCEADKLRVVCRPCHHKITQEQRKSK